MEPTILERVERVRARMDAACARAGRDTGSVRLLPVSKTQGPEQVAALAACGLTTFGENRVQEARQKIPLCPGHLAWHLIGHLQGNKVRDAVRLFQMIHAVDSLKLLEAVDRACEAEGRRMPVCLEVNVSGEGTKYGLKPDEVPGVLAAANALRRVDMVGLMTIPPVADDPELSRPYFRRLRGLRDQWRIQTGFELADLSMGMSGDFDVAIEEGATWVRLGTILFGARPKPAAPPAGRDSVEFEGP